MIWANLDSVYFIGAGGIGMSALARYFLSQGKEVAGYDRVPTNLTDTLEREGIRVRFEDRPSLIPDEFRNPERTLVIFTPAVPDENQQLNYFRKRGFRVIKRSVALGEVFNAGRGVGIAGTHGKTTISTLLATILHGTSLGCNAFLGGIDRNTGTNIYLDPASRMIIAEADEFDRSFLTLFPEIAVVSSMDPDHLDVYQNEKNMRKAFDTYVSQIREKGKLIHRLGLTPALPDNIDRFTYSLQDPAADYHARKVTASGLGHIFTAVTPELIIPEIEIKIPGKVNVENALAAIAVAHQLGVAPESIARGISEYRGVHRRFDVRVYEPEIHRVYIDDYAHHPEEIRAFLSAVRDLFPGKRITGIFQPHLYSRTRDFAEGFARSLEMLDCLILMEIYPAREEPIPGVNSSTILDMVRMEEKELVKREGVMKAVKQQDPELLVTMGAGDIDRLVVPLTDWMKKR